MGANQAVTREQPEVRFAGGGVSGGLTARDFTQAFRNHPAGVAVITADAGDGPVALTATSVFSVSVEPPLLVFSLSDQSSSAGSIQRAASVVVHLLGAGHLQLARLCATSGVDRFADHASWDRLASGEPYFTAVDTWIRGTIVGRMRAGASTVIALHALEARLPEADAGAAPLVYHNRSWHGLGEHSRVAG